MDNKENRKFYWEVKDFIQDSNKVQPKSVNKSSVLNSVKNIIEQNKPYTQNTFNSKINSNNNISQALSYGEKAANAGDPKCQGYSKNLFKNPFGVIKEGIFDDINKNIASYAQTSGMNPDATPEEIAYQISQQNIQPGVPLTPQQKALRDMEASVLVRQQQQASEKEAARSMTGLPQTRFTAAGREYSPKPSWAPQTPTQTQTPATPATAGVDVEGPPVPTAEEERAAATAAQQAKDTETATKTAEPAKDDELEKRVAGRMRTRDRNLAQQKQEASVQLAALQARGPMNNTPAARAMHAKALARLELRSKGEDLSVNRGLSDEQIRGQETRELERKRRGTQVQGTQPQATQAQGALPGKDITAQSPEQIAAANAPAKGGQSGIFGGKPSTASSTVPAPGTALAAASMPNRGIGRPGQTTTPAPQRTTPVASTATTPTATSPTTQTGGTSSLSTGAAVNITARETLGLGRAPATPAQTTAGVNAARETLGLGKPETPAPEESEAKKKARQTLMQ